jgi:hypothetical protein
LSLIGDDLLLIGLPQNAHEAFLVQVHDADQIGINGRRMPNHIFDKCSRAVLRNFDRVFDVALSEIFFRVVDVAVQLIFQKLIRFSRANDVHATVEISGHLSHRGQLLFGVLMQVKGTMMSS